jgi:hypothetical protein
MDPFVIDAGSPYADAGVTGTRNPYAGFANSGNATPSIAFPQNPCTCIPRTMHANTAMGSLSENSVTISCVDPRNAGRIY